MTFFYNIVFILFALVYSPFFILRLKNAPSKKRLLLDRLGFLPEGFNSAQGGPRIWIHAVSVGETMATRQLVTELFNRYPNLVLYFSTVTPTGQKLAQEILGNRVKLFYLPFDISWITERVMSLLSPQMLILMETELWPNLILSARKRQVRVGVLNGRFSPRSFRSYYRIKGLVRRVTRRIDFAAVQNESFKRRFLRLGFAPDKVFVTGNMKFDLVKLDANPRDEGSQWRRNMGFSDKSKIWIAASTHPGEERRCLWVFKRLRARFPALRLVLAPRHIERAAQLAREIREAGWSCRLASDTSAPTVSGEPDVYLLNTIGQLAKIYAAADMVFMGGSFIPHGGQNPIEAAAWKKPAAHGPFVFNFALVYKNLDEAGGTVLVKSRWRLKKCLLQWLEDEASCRRAGEKAYETLKVMQGASARNADLIASYLKP